MSERIPESIMARTWMDRVAKHIDDPILRLRFLKAVVPVTPGDHRKHRVVKVCLVTVALLVMLFAISRLRGTVRAETLPETLAAVPVSVTVPVTSPMTTRPAGDVWLVEKSGESETYSNGLRIDRHYQVSTHGRYYLAFPSNGGPGVRSSNPAGIVFHTTESQQAPFEESENRVLKRIGESLLEFIRRRAAYNYVIDRFGRVYRVVGEDQTANHSGNSVWADDQSSYVNLNQSFLAVSFEAVSPTAGADAEMNPAQVHAGAMLVEMLRNKYHIKASNCITHAQVSVNPSNMRLGYHVDWASGFPFQAIGLPDNYAVALPALWAYGFDCDSNFSIRAAERMRRGIAEAEAILAHNAESAGLKPAVYKSKLRQQYRQMREQMR